MNKAMAILKAVWEFCRYVFIPQRRPNELEEQTNHGIE